MVSDRTKFPLKILPATIALPNSYFCDRSFGRQAGWTFWVNLGEASILYSGTRTTFALWGQSIGVANAKMYAKKCFKKTKGNIWL